MRSQAQTSSTVHGHRHVVQVAQQIACGMASGMLLPLLDAASRRLAHMLRRVFDIAKLAMDRRAGGPGDTLRMYVQFHASLQVRCARAHALS